MVDPMYICVAKDVSIDSKIVIDYVRITSGTSTWDTATVFIYSYAYLGN